MKKGTKSLLPVLIGMDVNLVNKIEFIFVQGNKSKKFTYPSSQTIKIDDRTIGIIWTPSDKAMFKADAMQMDSRITLKDSPYQPDTNIVPVIMNDTLFEDI